MIDAAFIGIVYLLTAITISIVGGILKEDSVTITSVAALWPVYLFMAICFAPFVAVGFLIEHAYLLGNKIRSRQ